MRNHTYKVIYYLKNSKKIDDSHYFYIGDDVVTYKELDKICQNVIASDENDFISYRII